MTAKGINASDNAAMKAMPQLVGGILSPVSMKFDGVTECGTGYNTDVDYDDEHHFAEHEHVTETADLPGPGAATNRRYRAFW